MKKKLLGFAVLAALTCGAAQAKGTIKIATISPLSGPQSNLGLQVRNGTELALEEYKAQFKKLGFTLKLAPYDDQADPATGTAHARRVASDKEVVAVVGALNSGVTIPASEALRSSHVVMVTPASTANQVTDRGLPNINRIVARDDSQGPAAAKFLKETLKAKKVYILNDKTAYGEGLAGEVEKSLKKSGVRVVANEGTEEKNDFSSVIAKIKLHRPDIIYFGGVYNQVGIFIKQLRGAGIKTPIVGGDALDSSTLIKIAGGKSVNNVYFTTVAAPLEALPTAKKFASKFKKRFKANAEGYGAFSYDATKVVLKGLLKAIKNNNNKLPDRKTIANTVRNGKYAGLLSGAVSFNSAGDRKSATLYVMSIEDGKFKLKTKMKVKPPKK